MRCARRGFTLIELLVAAVVLGILMALVSVYFAQQTRVAGSAQAQNEAEMSARTVAEAIVQDLQIAGSRATVVGGEVTYLDIEAGGCDELNRSSCVEVITVAADGAISVPTLPAGINGIAMYYRSSVASPTLCRRVDYALVGSTLHRSDVACNLALSSIDLDASAFATDVERFEVDFVCSNGLQFSDPLDCYDYVDPVSGDATDDYVRQAEVTVAVRLSSRFATTAEMSMTAFTPNLRPSVNYGRFE